MTMPEDTMTSFAPLAMPRERLAHGPVAPLLWPLPACVQPGAIGIRWDAPPTSRDGEDRRYEVRLLDLRTHEVVSCAEVPDTGWTTPELPAGGVYEISVRTRESLPDGATSTSARAERRFRTGYARE
jgi:hypothetical protein